MQLVWPDRLGLVGPSGDMCLFSIGTFMTTPVWPRGQMRDRHVERAAAQGFLRFLDRENRPRPMENLIKRDDLGFLD